MGLIVALMLAGIGAYSLTLDASAHVLFSRALALLVASSPGLFRGCALFGRRSVCALRVVREFYPDLAQGDDVRPADNPDVFAAGGVGQPQSEIFLGVSDR